MRPSLEGDGNPGDERFLIRAKPASMRPSLEGDGNMLRDGEELEGVIASMRPSLEGDGNANERPTTFGRSSCFNEAVA